MNGLDSSFNLAESDDFIRNFNRTETVVEQNQISNNFDPAYTIYFGCAESVAEINGSATIWAFPNRHPNLIVSAPTCRNYSIRLTFGRTRAETIRFSCQIGR